MPPKEQLIFGLPIRLAAVRTLQSLFDLSILIACFITAYLLRFDFFVPQDYEARMYLQAIYVVFIQFSFLFIFRIPKFIWRYAGLEEAKYFLYAAVASFLPTLMLRI